MDLGCVCGRIKGELTLTSPHGIRLRDTMVCTNYGIRSSTLLGKVYQVINIHDEKYIK